MTLSVKRTTLFAGLAAAVTVASGSLPAFETSAAAFAATLTKATEVTNWFAEPEQGGQWEAQAKGDYAKLGLDMTTNQGGPQVSSIPLVASGKYTFGMASADSILQARQQGIPVVAIFSPYQIDPQVLIWHKSSSIKSFKDINGHPVYVSTAAPYWQYLKSKYKLTKSQQMTYTGSLVPFIHNPLAVIQGFATAEPYTLAKDKVSVSYELIANSGFNPYQNLMFTTEKEIKDHPNVVAAFVKASQQGWYQYLTNPTAGDSLIVKNSPDYTKPQLLYAVKEEKPLIVGGIAAKHGIGYMTPQRWNRLAKQMEQVGMLPKGFDASSAFTDKFIPSAPLKS